MTEVIGSGLEVVAYIWSHEKGITVPTMRNKPPFWPGKGGYTSEPLCRLSDAQAIIDGLLSENEALHDQVKVLQSDANSWQSGYDEGRRMGGKHCALTIYQQAQRIGELEGLLRHAQKQVPTGSGLHMRIDAALSAVCAAAPNIAPTSEHKVPEGIVSITRSLGRAIVRFNTSEQLNEFYRAAKSALPTERSGQIRSTPR